VLFRTEEIIDASATAAKDDSPSGRDLADLTAFNDHADGLGAVSAGVFDLEPVLRVDYNRCIREIPVLKIVRMSKIVRSYSCCVVIM
jgi:hypothetical protein